MAELNLKQIVDWLNVEFDRYDLVGAFWKFCEQHSGYTDVNPTLEKLVVTMFVSYTAKYVGAELPKPWKAFQSYKSGNIIAFLDNLMWLGDSQVPLGAFYK